MEDPATSSSIISIWTSINSWFTSTVFFILLNLMIATIFFISNLPTTNNHQPKKEKEQEYQNQNQNPQDRPKFARSPSILLNRLKSINFYPERPEQELFPETHHHLQEIEAAATQYVFNQPLHYEHFDLDININTNTNTNPTHDEVGQSDIETRVVETDTDHFDDPDPTQIHTEVSYQEDDEEEEKVEEEEETDEFESLDEVYSRLTGGGTHVDRSISDGAISPKPAKKVKKSMRKSASLKVGFANFEKEEVVEARRPETMRERNLAFRMTAEEGGGDDDDDDDVEVDSKAADFINKFKNDLILQRIESIAAKSK